MLEEREKAILREPSWKLSAPFEALRNTCEARVMCKYYDIELDLNTDNAQSRLLKLMEKKRKVLEFGCATGYVSRLLKEEFGCSVTGIEINPEAAREAEKYCDRVIVGDAEAMDFSYLFREEKFDVAIFGDFLEHLKNPGSVLRAVIPFLSKEGYVLASIPNIAHISVALDLLEGNFEYRCLGLLDDTHLRFFTKQSIVSLFKNSGYEIVLWDRVILKPEDTEFKTVIERYPVSLWSYFEGRGEAYTYQFVIKAVPVRNESWKNRQDEEEDGFGETLRKRVADQQIIIRDLRGDLSNKEAIIGSMLNSWSWKITSPLRYIYGKLIKVKKYLL